MKAFFLALALIAASTATNFRPAFAQTEAAKSPAEALRAGVPKLVWKGNMTALELTGTAPVGVFWGKETSGTLTPVAAASQLEKSRAVVVGGALFLTPPAFNDKANEQFVFNIMAWLAGEGRDAKTLKIGVLNAPNMDVFLKRRGYGAQTVTAAELADKDILLLGAAPLSEADSTPVAAFLARGGHLLTAATRSRIAGGEIESFSHNLLLKPFGLAFSRRMIAPTAPDGFGGAAP